MSHHTPRLFSHGHRCLSISKFRPLPTINHISPLASISPARCLATATPTTKAPPRRHAPIVRSIPTPPPTKTPQELASSPYLVRRTPSAQLPVYKQFKSGGNRALVLIKKVEGDRKRLLQDMLEALGLSQDSIRINPTTQHLEIKGDYHEKATSWLLARGF
ncbi:hypothetical protein E4U43_005253 [Claviceps pusilla]|uniref:Large ribosomal subunit protein mL49 n=1 Tax=Claviceps pusilla TaxID=123648 RepID=A0A9P7NEJ3_9HYPO|nr:hypothetical protein E4U43_005253 [Claviceps pusilla]